MGTLMQYDPKIDELEGWFTPKRFQVAWALARTKTTTFELGSSFGYSARELYRWSNGEATPHKRALVSIDRVFSGLLGEDWQAKVDFFIAGGEK